MIRKLLTVSICLTVLLTSSLFITVKTSATNDQVTIKVDLLNVRSGAGLTYSVIAKVKSGQTYDVVEKKNDWIKIKLSSNSTGWVAGWLVTEKKQTTSQKPASSENVSKSSTVTSNATGLRFRSGHGTTFSVIGVFDNGKSATYLENSGAWVKISYSGKQGWVSSQFVTIKNTAPSSNPSTSPSVKKTATVTATSLNVRNSASTKGAKIGSLKKNAAVVITKEQGDWAYVETNSIKGWVHSDYIKVSA